MIEHTKEQLEHCLKSAGKIVWGDSLSVSVATHYKLWAGKAKWLLKNTNMHLSKSEYQSNTSFIQFGDDSTELWMGA